MNLNNIVIVLDHPDESRNIGAACRAMANNDISELRIVGNKEQYDIEHIQIHKQLYLFSEQSVPQENNLVPEIREQQKDLERVMKEFYKNFVTFIECLFVYAFDSVGKNTKAVFVI